MYALRIAYADIITSCVEPLMGFFRAEAGHGGASDPALLARQLILVFDGASARAGIGADKLTELVIPTVTALLDAAKLP